MEVNNVGVKCLSVHSFAYAEAQVNVPLTVSDTTDEHRNSIITQGVGFGIVRS